MVVLPIPLVPVCVLWSILVHRVGQDGTFTSCDEDDFA